MEDNFFAVDKLVEFGLSMAVAQQMIQTMNQSLNHMQVAGTPNDTSWNHAAFYYVMIDEQIRNKRNSSSNDGSPIEIQIPRK